MAKSVKQPISELVTQGDDALMRRPAVSAGVTPIFDKCYFRVSWPEDVISGSIEGWIKPLTSDDCHDFSLQF